jgi:hypothetical protein
MFLPWEWLDDKAAVEAGVDIEGGSLEVELLQDWQMAPTNHW